MWPRRLRKVVALLALHLACAARAAAADNDTSLESEEESDPASFMVWVEHGAGAAEGRCGGSLVSQRTVLTSAACARRGGGGGAGALTVSRGAEARRVVRVAAVQGAAAEAREGWGAARNDLALLELEAQFASNDWQPILMATDLARCEARGTACQMVRASATLQAGEERTSVSIVEGAVVAEPACDALARNWAVVRDHAICLLGSELCSIDRGSGVVCNGKLCGVVSKSAGGDGDADCGNAHAVQSVPRWRRFLQCAHRNGACGRDRCADLCTESRPPDGDVNVESEDSIAALAATATSASLTTIGALKNALLDLNDESDDDENATGGSRASFNFFDKLRFRDTMISHAAPVIPIAGGNLFDTTVPDSYHHSVTVTNTNSAQLVTSMDNASTDLSRLPHAHQTAYTETAFPSASQPPSNGATPSSPAATPVTSRQPFYNVNDFHDDKEAAADYGSGGEHSSDASTTATAGTTDCDGKNSSQLSAALGRAGPERANLSMNAYVPFVSTTTFQSGHSDAITTRCFTISVAFVFITLF